jgi:hypothetical protein
MTDTTLWMATGEVSATPADIIQQAAPLSPTWRWIEPRPGCGLNDKAEQTPELKPDKLHPLLAPAGTALPTHPSFQIDEARLFWPDAALHIIADGVSPSRCAFWGLGEKPSPEQQALIDALGLTEADAQPVEPNDPEDVLTRHDLQRFGLKQADKDDQLRIQAYRADGVVVAWTICDQQGN